MLFLVIHKIKITFAFITLSLKIMMPQNEYLVNFYLFLSIN